MAGSFSASIDVFVRRAKGNIDQAVRETTALLAQGVILKTPVDTGRARGNWLFGVGEIPGGTTDDVDPSGQKVMAVIVSQIGTSRVGGKTYIANSLPYIERLENGWSKQAPSGMVKLTVQEFPDYVAQIAASLNK